MLGPRKMYAGTNPAASVRNHGTADDYFSYGSRSQVPTRRHYETPGVSDGPLSSPPKGSAKRLISRYEKMDSPRDHGTVLRNKSTRNRQYVYDYRAVAAAADSVELSDLHAPEKRGQSGGGGGGSKKDHSPLRQSLRNLFSVIKKGAGGLTKRKVGEEGVGRVLHRGDSLNGRKLEGKPFVTVPMGVEDDPIGHIGKRQKLTGSMFYLTRTIPLRDLDDRQLIPTGGVVSDWSIAGPGSEQQQLAWTSCNVTLDPSTRKMQLSSFNQEMQLVLHDISLAGCADIRSLSVSQLSERVAKLLDEASVKFEGELGRLKAFEVRFAERPTELFAVRSVKERAGWISAIWNVILPEANSNQPVSKKPMVRNSMQRDTSIENTRPVALPEMTTHSSSNRSLPPLPADIPEAVALFNDAAIPKLEVKKPVKLHLDIPPLNGVLSPSIYPPTSRASPSSSAGGTPLDTPTRGSRPPSSITVIRPAFLSPSTSPTTPRPASILSAISQSTSPSITNLSQLSMVRQRLAQIERNHSHVSSSSRRSSVLMPETPSAVSSQRSGRSKGKAEVLHAMTERGMTTESVPTLTAMNRDFSLEAGRLSSVEGLTTTTTTSLHGGGSGSLLDENKKYDERMSQARQLTKRDVEDLSMQVMEVKGVLGGESGYPTIHQVVLGLDDKAQANGRALKTVQERISQLLEGRLVDASVVLEKGAEEDEHESVLHAIEDVKARLATEFPLVMSTVRDLHLKQDRLLELSKDEREREVHYGDVATSCEGAQRNVVDLSPVLNKLEELRVSFGVSRDAMEEEGTEQPTTKLVEHVEKILALIQEESERRTVSSQQQADSVRYLNELNNWLEMFVNNGTSQIQGLSSNVEHLCRIFGSHPQQQQPGTTLKQDVMEEGTGPNLLGDIKQLVVGMQARDQNFAALQAAVHSLLEVLSSSQAQMGTESQAIATLITRQRQEQEVLLRKFTAEISGEIKGERLRFVEAMKEATAINVQLHVEHFKQDLGREVMVMTGEVGRLHREKQIIENQISDLFAFYSKHKQETPLQQGRTNIEAANLAPDVECGPVNIPRSSHYRPLPHPRRP